MNIERQIADYISENFLPDEEQESLGSDDDLLHVLNSLQFLRLVVHLEKTFSIQVDNRELTVDNLGSIAKLAAFVSSKQVSSDVLLDR